MECCVKECFTKAVGKGLCPKHLLRLKVHNTLLPTRVQYHGLPLKERFMKYVNKTESCWKWTGGLNDKGYGMVSVESRPRLAHRTSFKLFKGDIPEGMYVCHHCDIPDCVNPDHLFLGTPQDNMADMHAKGRWKYGTSLGENHGCAKLTDKEIRIIKNYPKKHGSGVFLAKRFNISRANISDIRNGRTWKHIT